VTETIESAGAAPKKKATGGLNSMLLADLKAMAGGMGIAGSGAMKKAQLIEAIKDAQGSRPTQRPARAKAEKPAPAAKAAPAVEQPPAQPAEQGAEKPTERRTRATRAAKTAKADTAQAPRNEAPSDGAASNAAVAPAADTPPAEGRPRRERQRKQKADVEAPATEDASGAGRSAAKADRRDGQHEGRRDEQHEQHERREEQDGQHDGHDEPQDRQRNQRQRNAQGQNQDRANDAVDDGEGGSRRNRRRRGRDRDRNRPGTARGDIDTEIREDDVLVPAAGILDVLDNYAFVRTSGYLPGPDDVYVSLSMVRKLGLRRGDAIVGQVRQPREGERREKFNPMVKIDSVNGADPTQAASRVEFSKLVPLYANERLRMETDANNLIGRVIDIAAPIGKGQRGLIVSPAKAGKTMIMQSIANSITVNNPECHLMVVLVDERPEEVTDFQRSVKGEVISSTFDRPASDHTIVAELAIERAKRLVELGHDVVVLLDGITRLGRAYNLAAPASGRILSGGVDSAALYPPKRFFGAARNIENGGSLTILATALIESGSKMDEVIFEEFKGTGNMEIRLRRDFAEKRLFPAIDAVQSGTRREELLVSKEELAIIWKLRRVLSALDGQQALELLLERLKKTHSNVEFLMQVQKTTPSVDGD
jgi:transcription termination factor Rho